MAHADDAQTIRSRFEALWPAEFSPAVPHTFSDVEYEPTEGDAWVRLTVISGEQRQVGNGNFRRFRRTGVVAVSIFLPAGSGDGQAQEIADAVANIFMGRTVNGVIFRGTGLTRVGRDGAWQVWTADTPYQADDLIAIS